VLRLLGVGTRTRHRSGPAFGVATGLLVGVTGCAASGQPSCAAALEQTADVVTPGDVPLVAESSANLGVDVTSTLVAPVRVTLEFDDVPALDVTAPGTPAECAHQPVHRYGYDLPPGTVAVSVTTDSGQRGSVDVRVGDRPQWVVVSVQEGFPLSVDVLSSRPEYG
jgi:hypothetical protein